MALTTIRAASAPPVERARYRRQTIAVTPYLRASLLTPGSHHSQERYRALASDFYFPTSISDGVDSDSTPFGHCPKVSKQQVDKFAWKTVEISDDFGIAVKRQLPSYYYNTSAHYQNQNAEATIDENDEMDGHEQQPPQPPPPGPHPRALRRTNQEKAIASRDSNAPISFASPENNIRLMSDAEYFAFRFGHPPDVGNSGKRGRTVMSAPGKLR